MLIAAFVGGVFGAILGSFVLALAHRSLGKRSFWGRSYCLFCKKILKWYDLFPVISFLILSGKCRYCRKKIPFEYPLVEIVMALLIGYLFWQSFQNFSATGGPAFGWQTSIFLFELLFKTFFISILGVVFITDYKKMLIPDRVMLPSIAIAFILILALTIYKIIYLYYYLNTHAIGKYLLPPYSDYFQRHSFEASVPFLTSLLSAIAIGGFFLVLIIITKGKGMGGGDVKLGAFIGLGLGFPNSLLAIMSAFLLGSIYSLFLIFSGKKHFGQVVPFGPFLVLGSLIALFWGSRIIGWYLSLGT